jgi:Zn finger protein HypA/HybF involved in hydrogenase expression
MWRMTRMRLAKRRRASYAPPVLRCEECGDVASGNAALWIALVVVEDERIAAYCPHCAETNFHFFSRRVSRRRKLAD